MLHIAMSHWSMDWHKYPKSRTSIRIRPPETMDSIKCYTFPGLGGKTFDILLHYSTLQFFLRQMFLLRCQPTQFYCDTCPACACTRPPVWLALLSCIHPSQLDAWPKAASGQHHWLWLGQVGCRATGPGPPIHLSGASLVSLSLPGVNCTATSHLSSWSGLSVPTHPLLQCLLRRRARLGFNLKLEEIHVEALPGNLNVMAGAGGSAGPEPDVRHQPPGRTLVVYYD